MKRARVLLIASVLGLAIAPMLAMAAPQPGSSSSALPAKSSASASASAIPSAIPAASATSDVDGGSVYATCIEHIPEGVKRPNLIERIPTRAYAGYAIPLEVIVEHGGGESVLPQGFSVQSSGTEAEGLTRSGFLVPEPDGGSPPKIEPTGKGDGSKTKVTLNVMALPKEPGRHEMVVPPLPIAIARASGELITVCTQPHPIVIEDPTSSTPDARPHGNPEARRQIEDWMFARRLAELLAVATVAAILGALLYRWWRRRPRKIPPPPPPRPPWETALEALYQLRGSRMIEDAKLTEYVDALSDIVRRYLGERFGFDGLEATSHEVRRAVRSLQPPLPVLIEIDRMLDESDLVKFARVAPSPEDCRELDQLAEHIIRATIPRVEPLAPQARPEVAA